MGTMRINGVTFIESEVVKLSLDEFVAQNIDVFWKDISRERRKQGWFPYIIELSITVI